MRRSTTVAISADGRDKGGVFVLTELPAYQATEWFLRAMQLLARSGTDVPPHIMAMGAAGFVTMGIGAVLTGLGKAPWSEVKPLLDELLLAVVSYQPPGAVQPQTAWPVIRTQIEEPATYIQIYEEVVSLHLNFSLRERLSTYRQLAVKMISALSQNIETSTASSPSSAPADSPA